MLFKRTIKKKEKKNGMQGEVREEEIDTERVNMREREMLGAECVCVY